MKYLFLSLICFLTLVYQSRATDILDSLENKLKSEVEIDSRLTILSDLLKNSLWEDIDRAKTYIDQYEKEAAENGIQLEIARSYNFYGMWYSVQSKYDIAIENYLIALDIYELENDTAMTGMMYNNIGASYRHLDKFEETVDYFSKARKYFELLGDKEWIANIDYNIGIEYMEAKNYKKALSVFNEVLDDYKARNANEFISHCLESIGGCIHVLEGPEAAIPYYLESLEYEQSRYNELFVWKSLCGCYTEVGRLDTAENYCDLAMTKVATTPDNTVGLEILEVNKQFYEKKKNFQKAIEITDMIMALKDSIYINQRDVEYLALLKKYDSEKKDQVIATKDALLLQKAKQEKLYNFSLVLAVILLLGAIAFIYFKIKSNKILTNKNKIIQNQLEDKNILMKEIHHRVKNNLQIISSLLNIQSREINDELAIEAINLSRNRVKSMAIIHQSLYQKENITNINVKDYIERLSLSIFNSYKIDQDNIQFITEVDDLDLDIDLTIPLGLIINELVTNSLKHAFPKSRKGKIEISLKKVENDLNLIISDNGIGIENIEGNSSSFGLKMIKIFAKKLKATYSVENDNGSKISLIIKNYNVQKL